MPTGNLTAALPSRNAASRSLPITEWLFSIVVALSVAGYPLVSALPELFNTETRVFSVPFRGVFLALSVLVSALAITDRSLYIPKRFGTIFALFWLLYLTRLVTDTVLEPKALGFEVSDYWLFTIGVTLIPAVAFSRLVSATTLARSTLLSIVFLIVACASNLWVGWNEVPESALFRFGTDSVNPIAIGTVAARLFVLCTYVLISKTIPLESRPVSRRLVLLAVAALPLAALALFFSGSRGPIFATVVCVVLSLGLMFSRARSRIVIPIALVLLVLGVIAVVLPFVVNLGGSVLERFYVTFHSEDQSDIDRITLWENGFTQFLDSPFTGSGIEEQRFQFYPHNLFLEAYMATGIVGGTLFVGMALYTLYIALRQIYEYPSRFWIPLVYINSWIISLFSGSIWGAATVIHFMLLVVALEHWHRRRRPAAAS